MKEYYRILGVSRTASQADIRRAYRKLVQQLHPDINPAPEAHALIREVNEAYEILGDPVKRSDYDYRFENPFASVEEPAMKHRDPAYRRRTYSSPAPRNDPQRELMMQFMPYTDWLFRAGLVIALFLCVDFFLPPKQFDEVINGFQMEQYRRNPRYFLNTNTGREIKIAYEDRVKLQVGQEITIRESLVLAIVRKAIVRSGDDIFVLSNLATLYGNFIFVPVLLVLSALAGAGMKARGSIEFRFNLAIVHALLIIFTTILILIS
jgi:hypothetical protein